MCCYYKEYYNLLFILKNIFSTFSLKLYLNSSITIKVSSFLYFTSGTCVLIVMCKRTSADWGSILWYVVYKNWESWFIALKCVTFLKCVTVLMYSIWLIIPRRINEFYLNFKDLPYTIYSKISLLNAICSSDYRFSLTQDKTTSLQLHTKY